MATIAYLPSFTVASDAMRTANALESSGCANALHARNTTASQCDAHEQSSGMRGARRNVRTDPSGPRQAGPFHVSCAWPCPYCPCGACAWRAPAQPQSSHCPPAACKPGPQEHNPPHEVTARQPTHRERRVDVHARDQTHKADHDHLAQHVNGADSGKAHNQAQHQAHSERQSGEEGQQRLHRARRMLQVPVVALVADARTHRQPSTLCRLQERGRAGTRLRALQTQAHRVTNPPRTRGRACDAP